MPITGPDPALRVLVVCTANICRSPMAEQFLRHALKARSVDAVVSSAGFLFDGRPASDTTQKVLGERGFDLSRHRSRIIDGPILDAVDVVLTMERRHARDLALEHDVADKIHTFTSFAEALRAGTRGAPVASVAQALDAAACARPEHAFLGDNRPDEVADPHGRSARVHRKVADALAATADDLAAAWTDLFTGVEK